MKSLEEHLEQLKATINNEVDTRIRWMRHAIAAEEAIDYLKENFGGAYETINWSSTSTGTIYANISTSKFSHLASYLRRFRQLDWKRTYSNVKETSSPSWTFRNEKYDGVSLYFTANFPTDKADPNACHLEVVGTETKEVEIKRLVCPEGAMDFDSLSN